MLRVSCVSARDCPQNAVDVAVSHPVLVARNTLQHSAEVVAILHPLAVGVQHALYAVERVVLVLHSERVGLVFEWERKSTNIFGKFAEFAVRKFLPAGGILLEHNLSHGVDVGVRGRAVLVMHVVGGAVSGCRPPLRMACCGAKTQKFWFVVLS